MWLSVSQAAKAFGYKSAYTLRQRIRQLREQGFVSDLGDPPEGYRMVKDAPVQILWGNPKSMMVNDESSPELLNGQVGRPTKESS